MADPRIAPRLWHPQIPSLQAEDSGSRPTNTTLVEPADRFVKAELPWYVWALAAGGVLWQAGRLALWVRSRRVPLPSLENPMERFLKALSGKNSAGPLPTFEDLLKKSLRHESLALAVQQPLLLNKVQRQDLATLGRLFERVGTSAILEGDSPARVPKAYALAWWLHYNAGDSLGSLRALHQWREVHYRANPKLGTMRSQLKNEETREIFDCLQLSLCCGESVGVHDSLTFDRAGFFFIYQYQRASYYLSLLPESDLTEVFRRKIHERLTEVCRLISFNPSDPSIN